MKIGCYFCGETMPETDEEDCCDECNREIMHDG